MRALRALVDSPLTVELAGVELTVPHCGCDLWLPALAGATHRYMILNDLLDDASQGALRDVLTSGKAEISEIDKITNALIAEGAGRDWWVALRIIDAADAYWEIIGGRMALGGVTPSRVTFATWLDATWYLIRHQVAKGKTGEQDLRALVAEVMASPLEELEVPEGEEVEMDEGAFMAAASGMAGPVAG